MAGIVEQKLAAQGIANPLANPTLRQEERESLNNIAVVVPDNSTSQSLAARPAQMEAIRRELETKLAAIPNLEIRWVTSSQPTGESATGTTLFADLNRA